MCAYTFKVDSERLYQSSLQLPTEVLQVTCDEGAHLDMVDKWRKKHRKQFTMRYRRIKVLVNCLLAEITCSGELEEATEFLKEETKVSREAGEISSSHCLVDATTEINIHLIPVQNTCEETIEQLSY